MVVASEEEARRSLVQLASHVVVVEKTDLVAEEEEAKRYARALSSCEGLKVILPACFLK